MAGLRIGSFAFTAAGWPGKFYPKGLPEREYLTYCATKFDTVEIDSTFYRTPALTTVKGWYSKTPKGFLVAAKVPHRITHGKVLVDWGCVVAFTPAAHRCQLRWTLELAAVQHQRKINRTAFD
jgi:uncharacterized protein YecE (DUF72 family)